MMKIQELSFKNLKTYCTLENSPYLTQAIQNNALYISMLVNWIDKVTKRGPATRPIPPFASVSVQVIFTAATNVFL